MSNVGNVENLVALGMNNEWLIVDLATWNQSNF